MACDLYAPKKIHANANQQSTLGNSDLDSSHNFYGLRAVVRRNDESTAGTHVQSPEKQF